MDTPASSRHPSLDLPFDEGEMVDGIARWAACESPTWDAAAVNRMIDLARGTWR